MLCLNELLKFEVLFLVEDYGPTDAPAVAKCNSMEIDLQTQYQAVNTT